MKSSPLYGMPIINVDEARSVFVLKPSMASGFAGIENPLFFKPNTRMRFGDAKVRLLDQPRRRSYCSVRERSRCTSLSRASPTLGRPAGNVSRDDVVLLCRTPVPFVETIFPLL